MFQPRVHRCIHQASAGAGARCAWRAAKWQTGGVAPRPCRHCRVFCCCRCCCGGWGSCASTFYCLCCGCITSIAFLPPARTAARAALGTARAPARTTTARAPADTAWVFLSTRRRAVSWGAHSAAICARRRSDGAVYFWSRSFHAARVSSRCADAVGRRRPCHRGQSCPASGAQWLH